MRGARGAILLIASVLAIAALPVPARAQPQAAPTRRALVVMVEGLSYDQALADPTLVELAGSGGIGLMTRAHGRPFDPEERFQAPGITPPRGSLLVARVAGHEEPGPGARLGRAMAGLPADEVLVLVIGDGEPNGIVPLIMARGAPQDLLAGGGQPRGLTSDTTRREGMVASVDVVPTVLHFLGLGVPELRPGTPIRVEGEAPTNLHRRFQEYRRAVLPTGVAALAFAVLPVVAGVVVLWWRRAPTWLAGGVAVWGVVALCFAVALLPASWLPSFDAEVLIPAVVLIGAGLAAPAMWARDRSAVAPVALVAGAGLALVVADAAMGWPALLTPFIGGSALEGVRFFGLGNPLAGMVLAGAVLVAAVLPTAAGLVLLVAAALFAGLPFLGADVGGALVLFAAAGLWWALRVRRRFRVPEAVVTGVTVGAGLAVVILAHRLWPVTEHLTAVVGGPDGVAGAVDAFRERLLLNAEMTARTPAVWPVLLLIPIGLAIAWWRLGPFGPALRRRPAWRDAAVVLAAGVVLGYVLNDTFGMSTVAFLFLAAALVFPALEERWRTA